jgi:hypothetical protein
MVELRVGTVEDHGAGGEPLGHMPAPPPTLAPENNAPQPQAQLEQLQACQKELQEVQLMLERDRAELAREIERRAPGEAARAHAVGVQEKANNDAGAPLFKQARQNVAAAVAILDGLSPPASPEEKQARERM